MKKTVSIILIFCLMLLFSSCSKSEIDKTAIINSVYVSSENGKLYFDFNTVQNENTSVLKKYSVSADSIFQAKESLEKSAVSDLFLGQLECIVFSNNMDCNEIFNCLEDFTSGYECSPGVKLLFATPDAMRELKEKEIPITRLVELCNIAQTKNSGSAVNIYSFYNYLKRYENNDFMVNLLYSKSQLDVKTFPFYGIKTESE